MATQVDIESHYDVNNDFFALFLDKKYRVYTCAVWDSAKDLEQAQEAKLDRICRYANIRPGDNVIDVGCGFGGLLKYIAEEYKNTRVHGLTLSPAQCEYINSVRLPSVSANVLSWENHVPDVKYDAIVSVCAIEHFATFEDQMALRQRDIYKTFFDWCLNVSTDEAQIGLQTIIITRPPKNLTELRDSKFLLNDVFPGSALSSISDIQAAIVDKYEISAANRIGLDYARTLTEWKIRLELNKEVIVSRYGQDLFDHYVAYFDAARRCFESGYTDVYQVSLKRATSTRILS